MNTDQKVLKAKLELLELGEPAFQYRTEVVQRRPPARSRVLHDPDLAAAIVDRILERGRVRRLDGPFLRTRHLGLDDPTAPEASTRPARFSGIQRRDFSAPTRADENRAGQALE